MLLAVALGFHGIASHEFLNWDDAEVLVGNARLSEPGVVAWAFSTGFVGHYQPLSWLAWSAIRGAFGIDATAHHLLSLAFHLLNTALVFGVAAALARGAGVSAPARRLAAAAAAVSFGLHPLRVEPVAWASAFPYVLSLGPLLAATLAYLRFVRGDASPWLAAAVGLYATSALVRPAAPGFAVALLALDAWTGRRAAWRRVLLEKLPFVLVGVAGAFAEASARRFSPLDRVGAWERVEAAAWAPLAYLGQTLWPTALTPLRPLPLTGSASPTDALAPVLLLLAASAATLRLGRTVPALPAAWVAYLALLAPAAGLLPSGLQASADRYSYLPAVALSLLAGGGLARLGAAPSRRVFAVALLAVATLAMGLATVRYLPHWRDSAALWGRALAVDPRNDVALYNLALALEERGADVAAMARYDELLRLVPEHGPARQNRDRLEARRLEHEGGALAHAGRLAEAVEAYSKALRLDPRRLHSRRSRGMALAQIGRFAEAVPDLRDALATGPAEPAVVHALAYALRSAGRAAEADALLAGPGPR